ncbi:MAG: endo alpha-1,4 polygalactosaminidase [Myxococcales bacterium]|nr:endo alpha-1,4 polygalactosaminidase [Myxococcales bacterium]
MLACSDDTKPPAADTTTGSDRGTPGADRGVGFDGAGAADTGTMGDASDGGGVGDAAGGDSASPAAIWRPKPGTSWQWQLSGTLDTSINVAMYDIDLFDTAAATIQALHTQGRVVICYFSAGSYEDWRPDASSIPAAARGKKLDGWNELWLDVRHAGVRDVMKKRLALAKQKGCDGVEPDNVDGYANDNGFGLAASDQLAYNRFLADEAHKLGLSVGLKNDLDQVKALVASFDWALDEECAQYDECDLLKPFIAAGKAVFHVEYTPTNETKVCSVSKQLGLDTLIKRLELDAWRKTCP